MQLSRPEDLIALSQAFPPDPPPAPKPPRSISIWEITQWILPMAPEHLRRVLAATPELPQGSASGEGGTRWFTPAEVAILRAHFAAGGRARYQGGRPAGAKTGGTQAAVVALAGPQGGSGRSSSLLHLATAAALAGYRVLVIDADPAGRLAASFGLPAGRSAGVMSLLALTAAAQLRRLNEARMDRGEPPLAMAESLVAALTTAPGDLIQPTTWPGLDLLAAGPDLMQADLQIIGWRAALRGWQPWQALAAGLQSEGLCARYDLILIDTGRGLGPLALAMLSSAEILLAPLMMQQQDQAATLAGLAALGQAVADLQAEAAMTARALGQAADPPPLPWQRLLLLPVRSPSAAEAASGLSSAALLAGFAAKLGAGQAGQALLPCPLPDLPPLDLPLISEGGHLRNFYDLDYRDLGRQSYAPLRQSCQEAWQAFAAVLQQHWARPASGGPIRSA